MRISTILLLVATLVGCAPPTRPNPAETPGYAQHRERLFLACLDRAKVLQSSTHYADNAEVVSECSSAAYYMAQSYALSGDSAP